MDERAMIDLAALPLALTLPVAFIGGLLLGLVYFRAVRLTADLIVGQKNPLLGLALALGRLALLGVGLYVAVLAGAPALLAALAGVLLAKFVMVRLIRKVDA
jgi:hypothetical protein